MEIDDINGIENLVQESWGKYESGQYDEASKLITKALQSHSRVTEAFPSLFNLRGIYELNNGNYEESLKNSMLALNALKGIEDPEQNMLTILNISAVKRLGDMGDWSKSEISGHLFLCGNLLGKEHPLYDLAMNEIKYLDDVVI